MKLLEERGWLLPWRWGVLVCMIAAVAMVGPVEAAADSVRCGDTITRSIVLGPRS